MVLPVPGVRITAFQRNAFQNNAFQIGSNGAQYFLLCPHFLNDVFLEQWTTVTDNVEIPANWVPTMEVDPLNTPAVNAFYAAGPRVQPQSRVWDNQNWSMGLVKNPTWVKPVTYWVQSSPGFYKLTGLGASLAPVPGP